MKFENAIICKKAQLKIHETINDQMKDELLYIWTWIVIWNKNSFNVLCQLVMILKKWSDQQISTAITIHNCWK